MAGTVDLTGDIRVPQQFRTEVKVAVWTSRQTSYDCHYQASAPRQVCQAMLPSQPNHLELSIMVPGYEAYWHVLPPLTYRDGVASLELGVIKLQKAKDVYILAVTGKRAKETQAHYFDLTVANTTNDPHVITRLHLDGQEKLGYCSEVGTAEYTIADTLRIYGGKPGILLFTGEVHEVALGSEALVLIHGSLSYNFCNGSFGLALDFPATFDLPPHSFSPIRIAFPARLHATLRNPPDSATLAAYHLSFSDSIRARAGETIRLILFTFVLETDVGSATARFEADCPEPMEKRANVGTPTSVDIVACYAERPR